MRRRIHTPRLLMSLLLLSASAVKGQTTTFTYQGQLTDGGAPANGSFDLRCALFDSAAGSTQIGATQTVSAVAVQDGAFTVQLDFGAGAFPGANRFLEIAVRPAGSGSFTTLAPRQQISSTPYAIRTLSAATADALSSACVACVQDTQINAVAGSKVSGAIPAASVPSGSGNYVQNTTTPQANSNFNISGNGVVGGNLTVTGTLNANLGGNFIRNASTQQTNANFNISGSGTVGQTLSAQRVDATLAYDLGGDPVLVAPGTNLFAGIDAGPAAVPRGVIIGSDNSFFGYSAGNHTGGDANAFFGAGAGEMNTSGSFNACFGAAAGALNDMGSYNAFFGLDAGAANEGGSRNTIVGARANVGAASLTNAAAIGANAQVNQSNALVLGSIAGVNQATASVNVGIGTTTPTNGRLDVDGGDDTAIWGQSTSSQGVHGYSQNSVGVYGEAQGAFQPGVAGINTSEDGIGVLGASPNGRGVSGVGGSNSGVYGESETAHGVYGQAHGQFQAGVFGTNDNASGGLGVSGFSVNGRGVSGVSNTKEGVYGYSGGNAAGVYGESANSHAVFGQAHVNGQAGVFGTNDSAVGGFGVLGTTSKGAAVQGNASGSGGIGVVGGSGSVSGIGVYGANSAEGGLAGRFDGTLQVNGLLHVAGDVCANNMPCVSDARLKRDITPLGYGLREVMRLRPVTWKWKASPAGKPQLGLVAQEVEPVLPELVDAGTDSRLLSMNYMGLLPVVIKAVQEQQATIATLTTANAALQKENAALAARVTALEREVPPGYSKPTAAPGRQARR